MAYAKRPNKHFVSCTFLTGWFRAFSPSLSLPTPTHSGLAPRQGPAKVSGVIALMLVGVPCRPLLINLQRQQRLLQLSLRQVLEAELIFFIS